MKNKHRILFFFAALAALFALFPMTALAAKAGTPAQPGMYATFWALVPPVVAIALALINSQLNGI